MKHSHVGHDAIVKEGCTISCGAKIGGHAIIGENTNIGLNAVIHQRKIVPANCMVGMGSVVTKGLIMAPGMKYAGNPAKLLGENIKK
jgi:UDP-N-acetylglucosamine acyltransferase